MSHSVERYVIKHLSGSKLNQVEEFDFSKNELSIGRSAGSDIQYDPEREVVVSREHGKITKISSEPPKFAITDNNSRNGIFVNKNRVKGTIELQPGDEVQLGNNGPVFSFDIYPRPQDMMAATRVVEIPTSIKATTISEVTQAASAAASEPVKTGLGKQTVERMLVAERKKSFNTMAFVIGGLVLVLGALGFAFRDKIFGKSETVINNIVADTTNKNKKTPDVINRENDAKVVQIEFGWQLRDTRTGDELWHEYVPVKDAAGNIRFVALYIQNAQGAIEPYINVKRNVADGIPVGMT
ncbi:MAG: FHA domain-containing protein, partial [Chitinophagaceae bacterium]|nr:FHA domain-containing protein [Chitinophagaceae bacterium]